MVTIKQIAKAVGVSSATVSRVLNYDPALSISPAKRQAVIETAEALNYETPRNRNRGAKNGGARASGARGGQAPGSHPDDNRLPRLALVHFLEPSEELSDPYYIGVRLGIENRCKDLKTEIIKVYHSDDLPSPALLQGATGVIVVGKHSAREIDWLKPNSRHLVFADFNPRRDDIDCVFCDLGAATRGLLDNLDATGYQRIGFIGSFENIDGHAEPYGEQRCRSYIDWCREKGRFDEDLLVLGNICDSGQNLRLETGYMLAQKLLAVAPLPDAIVTANDNMAIGAYRAIQEAGLSIPEDIAVVSFNDIPVAQFMNPPLSTVRIGGEHVGEAAVDLLLEQIAGRDFNKKVIIPTRMIWRQSSRAPEGQVPTSAE
ncbi:LacI family DNA-binding transcriptional regulator [Roseibium litorale]|uniref:LacI family DNA-binding transcriptional regulator n=1 Tax=Roseibium litorale TaxID=2803841 RepID=A0ABR9CQN3_9HYPH|nr:LacI family DNA-binding transcriptional regulator [Roseibium litorale]MBD8892571.1 LacI family DNA-binding transcriptional regulator [Roseibium litorale]